MTTTRMMTRGISVRPLRVHHTRALRRYLRAGSIGSSSRVRRPPARDSCIVPSPQRLYAGGSPVVAVLMNCNTLLPMTTNRKKPAAGRTGVRRGRVQDALRQLCAGAARCDVRARRMRHRAGRIDGGHAQRALVCARVSGGRGARGSAQLRAARKPPAALSLRTRGGAHPASRARR